MKINNLKLNVLIFMILSVIGIALVIFYNTRLVSEFPVANYSDSFEGEVIDCVRSRAIVRITLNGNRKRTVQPSMNYNYSPSNITSFLRVGDLIVKRKETDTILIKRGSEEYFFVIGKAINKND